MTLKGDVKFKGKQIRDMKNYVRNWLIFMGTVKSLKIFTLLGSFCPNHVKIQMRNYKRVMYHDTEK